MSDAGNQEVEMMNLKTNLTEKILI